MSERGEPGSSQAGMPRWPAWILFTAMAACTYPAVTAPPLQQVPTSEPPLTEQPQSYRAVGTEPFWSVKLENGQMIFEDSERRRIAVANPRHRTTFNGHRYESPRLTLDISRGRCSDGMSDTIYPDTVLVIADGRELRGCGATPAPIAALAGTRWSIVGINGDDVARSRQYEISFEREEISGRAGCNSFSGSYRMEGDRLTAGPLTATRMACPGVPMRHEQFVFELMREPVRVSLRQDGVLVLSGQQGFLRLERR